MAHPLEALFRGSGAAVAGVVLAALPACDSGTGPNSQGTIQLETWFHAGRREERRTIRTQVERFNTRHQGEIEVELTLIPEGSYNAQVQAAALAGELPDLLEFDGPYLYNYVWQGHLIPLEPYLPNELWAKLLPTIVEQGSYRGHLYSVATFDSALGLYARRSRLAAIGVEPPTAPEEAWTTVEFQQILADLAARDPDGAVLDLHLNYRGEWYPYAFAPVLWSAGAGLIDHHGDPHARGILNSPAAVSALQAVQGWLKAGYVDPNLDDAAFTEGRVALSWGGHWNYPRYATAVGEDLVVLPLPDFGEGTRTAQGSWNWGITTRCTHPEAAAELLAFLLQTEEVLAMTRANGAVPGTLPALQRSERYGAGGPLQLFATQLQQGYARPRPKTPAYPVISVVFQEAFSDLRHGMAIERVLDRAAAAIDRDIRDNEGYRYPGSKGKKTTAGGG